MELQWISAFHFCAQFLFLVNVAGFFLGIALSPLLAKRFGARKTNALEISRAAWQELKSSPVFIFTLVLCVGSTYHSLLHGKKFLLYSFNSLANGSRHLHISVFSVAFALLFDSHLEVRGGETLSRSTKMIRENGDVSFRKSYLKEPGFQYLPNCW